MSEKRTSIRRPGGRKGKPPKRGPEKETQEEVTKNPEGGSDVMSRVLEMEAEQKAKRIQTLKKVGIGIVVLAIIGVGYYYLSTGLNDKRVVELNRTVEMMEQEIEGRDAEIEQLIQAVEDTTVKEVVPITSLTRVEGSKVPELHLIEGDFIAPNPLRIEGTQEDVNDTFIQVGSRFRFKPSEGWVVALRGSTLELGHPEKIWGKVQALSQRDPVDADTRLSIIQGFFVGYPSTTINYRKMYIEDRVVGLMGTAEVPVVVAEGKSKTMTINVGMVQRSDYGLQFMFVNETEGSVSQELIMSFLQTGVFGNQSNIKIE